MDEARTLDELWQMYAEVCDNAFLGYEKRWGEPMPNGGWKTAPLPIRARIEAAIREPLESRLEAYEASLSTAADRIEDLMGYRRADYNDYDPAPDIDLIARLRELSTREGGAG